MEGFWSSSCRCAYTCVLLSEPKNSFTSTTIEHGLAIAKIPVNTFAIRKDQCHFSQPFFLSIMEITRVSGLEIITIMGRGYKNFPFSILFTLRRNSNVIYFCIKLNVIQWYTGKEKVEERKGKIYTYMDHICRIYKYGIFQVKQIRSLPKITWDRQIG